VLVCECCLPPLTLPLFDTVMITVGCNEAVIPVSEPRLWCLTSSYRCNLGHISGLQQVCSRKFPNLQRISVRAYLVVLIWCCSKPDYVLIMSRPTPVLSSSGILLRAGVHISSVTWRSGLSH
jgi:hypothetical protein